MDRVVTRSRWQKLRPMVLIVASLVAMVAVWQFAMPQGGKTLSVGASRLNIATVTQGVFEDFIPVRGRVVPRRTVRLASD